MIAADDVRQLLEHDDPEAVLVLIEGRVEVVSPRQLDTPQYQGALQVISRDDLLQRIGAQDLSDRVVEEQAVILESTVAELGG